MFPAETIGLYIDENCGLGEKHDPAATENLDTVIHIYE
jgi:hypothetical protein